MSGSPHSTLNRVDSHVYIGGYLAAADPILVKGAGFTHILKLFADDDSYPGGHHRHPGVDYLVIGAEDTSDYPLDQHFSECLKFIQGAVRTGGKVLVHCHAGVSRSASIVLLHLMVNSGLSFDESLAHLRKVRPVASPNFGFLLLLTDVGKRADRIRAEGRAPPRPNLSPKK